MDPVAGAVVIAGLQKFGGPVSELVRDFLTKVLSPTGEALGSVVAHPIVEWQRRRVDRGKKLLENAAAALEAAGREPKPVPARVLMPLLERGSLEEDSELRDRWVALLANAASNPDEVIPAFVSILSELSPSEARILRRLDEIQSEQRYLRQFSGPDDSGDFRRLTELDKASTLGQVRDHAGIDSDFHLNILIANLQRLGLLAVTVSPSGEELHALRVTRLGRALVAACSQLSKSTPRSPGASASV